jgi:hypothetical protein
VTTRSIAATAVALVLLPVSAAYAAPGAVELRWIPGSTAKVEQLVGDCDYSAQATTGQCVPTTSRTLTRAEVLGTDLGSSFESDGRLIILFGDTIGPIGGVNYNAADTMASTTSTSPEGVFLEFFTNPDGSPYFVRVPGVRLGASEVPEAGIRLDDTTYIAFKTGTDINAPDPTGKAYSVLTRFDENARRFTLLRTISSMPDGRFISMAFHDFGSDVVMFGLGAYRASNVYLASTPANKFATGEGTRYFAGLAGGQPVWSTSESGAVPVVVDNPLDRPGETPTIGNVSIAYAEDLDLWLMTYDGGTQSRATAGVYFTYAPQPWGPWSKPQLIFNPRRDGALGTFIHDPSILPNPPGDGLNGPTIGPNDPYTTHGGLYAPFMIERFIRVAGRTLSIYYIVSTWNPYTVVEMRSDFEIVPPSSRRRSVRH